MKLLEEYGNYRDVKSKEKETGQKLNLCKGPSPQPLLAPSPNTVLTLLNDFIPTGNLEEVPIIPKKSEGVITAPGP